MLQLYLPEFGKTYGFDTVFNEDTSQTSVYAVSAQPASVSGDAVESLCGCIDVPPGADLIGAGAAALPET